MMRLAIFVACLLMVMGLWAAVNEGQVNSIWVLVLAFLLSGIASYFLLRRQREAFAQRVEKRASRAADRFEQMKAREDVD